MQLNFFDSIDTKQNTSLKRWTLIFEDKKMNLWSNSKEELIKLFKPVSIEENTDYSYLKYVDKIKEISKEIKLDCRGREVYTIFKNNITIHVKFLKEGNLYLDTVEYQATSNNSIHIPVIWDIENIDLFYNKYLKTNSIEYVLYSFRKYGQPKLSKPKELKGIKQSFNVEYIPKKCKCECFAKDNDLYIKHKDYFSEHLEESPELFGTPLEYRIKKLGINSKKKSGFVYSDCWGDIVLRNEAWIVIKNIKQQSNIKSEYELSGELKELFRLFNKMSINRMHEDWYWCNFWDCVAKEYINYVNKE